MKRNVFINSLSNGGAERVVSRLSQDKEIAQSAYLWLLEGGSFYESNYEKIKSFSSSSKLLSILLSFISCLKLNKDDLIQAHLNLPIIITGFARTFKPFSMQAVHCFSYSSFFNRKKSLKFVLYRKMLEYALLKTDKHIFKSIEMIEDFEGFWGWAPKNYVVINNPVDIDLIKEKSNQIQGFYTDSSRINIAIVGRINSSKRPWDVLDVAANYMDKINFHFFGDGPEYHALKDRVSEHKLENIFLHGSVKNPFKYIKKFGFYLSCSESEGFPNALVEALVCDAFCIHSDCLTGPREILTKDYNNYKSLSGRYQIVERGILFPVGDKVALCGALDYLCSGIKVDDSFTSGVQEYLDNLRIEVVVEKYKKELRI
ncbi:glycosyltransferase [Salinivibrio costicola]|uniref:glycosyltransferase n=1 Tax=Salinivibrio costicola TaxID=51367 RepID=UPI003F72EE27